MSKTSSQISLGFYQLALGFTSFRTINDTSTTDWIVSFFRPPFAVSTGETRTMLTAKWDGLQRGTNGNIRQFCFSTNDGSISVHWGLPISEACYEILESSIKVCFYKKTQRQNQFPNYKACAFIPLSHVFHAKEMNNEKKIKGTAPIFLFKEENGAFNLSKTEDEQLRGISDLEYELTLTTQDLQTDNNNNQLDCISSAKKNGSISEFKEDVLCKSGNEKKPLISVDTLQQQNADMKMLLNKALQEKDRLQKQIATITSVVKAKPMRSQK